MKVKITFVLNSQGDTDELILDGTLEEIQEKALAENLRRGAVDAWSTVLEED